MLNGPPGEACGSWVWDLGDVDGDGHPELGVHCPYSRSTLVVRDLPSPGRWDLVDWEVGRLPEANSAANWVSPAGDTDRDGFGDVWFGWRLFRGPFEGTRPWDDFDAEIDQAAGEMVVGNFDADGDGELDMALSSYQQSFEIHYGPFSGSRPGAAHPEADPAQMTVVERDWGCDPGTLNLGALNEPGQIVLTAGWDGPIHCADARAYDVRGPRGRVLTQNDAIAVFPKSWNDALQALPDFDGDGLDDVLYVMIPRTAPIGGWYPNYVLEDEQLFSFHGQQWVYGTHDVSGDGLADFVIGLLHDQWFVVAGTVRGLDHDVGEVGVRLAATREAVSGRNWLTVDLDGDGLAEVLTFEGAEGDGYVEIWTGASLKAALDEVAGR